MSLRRGRENWIECKISFAIQNLFVSPLKKCSYATRVVHANTQINQIYAAIIFPKEERKTLIDTEPPALEFPTRRHGHLLCQLPLHGVSAPETLRFLVSPLFERSFPFALRAQFLDIAVLDVAV
jgi:hypothetical protein